MRYPASEKLEIIRLVEQSRLSARRTLQKLGVARSTSIAGMIASSLAVSTRWRIAGLGRTGFGTAFPRRREIRSSSWR